MEMVVIKFRSNDLNSSLGKQIEFNPTVIKDFFKFKQDVENTTFTYKALDDSDSNNNTNIKVVLKKAPARGDYKVYQNEDGSLFLKTFLLANLNLSENNINDYLAIRKKNQSNYEFTYIPATSEIGEFFNLHKLGLDGGSIIRDDLPNKNILLKDKPYNRIVFGAPGTGKSNLLKTDSEYFENQEQASGSKDEMIKQAIIEADNSNDKSNKFIAIGFMYSNELKSLSRKDIHEKYKLAVTADNIYIGVQAKKYYENISDDSSIEAEIKKAKEIKGDGMLQYLAGIGFKYADSFVDYTKEELKAELLLDSNPQVYWVYRAIHGAKYLQAQSERKEIKFFERVTFHPNYTYAQFVGTYKPVQDSNDDEKIRYEYVPGPFMRVYVNALKNKDKNFLLLIEEINRANVSAVFGDVFQLLDRDAYGNSEYPITISEDVKKYLARNGINDDKLSIPSNMYIWATMNSADQGVLPMDAAFKRRWDFEYIGINEGESNLAKVTIPVPNGTEDDGKTVKYVDVEWNKLRKAINAKLKNIPGVNEDKLIGPFFIGDKTKIENAAKDKEQFCKSFKSKVLMYLFEDVCKMRPTALFNVNVERPHYSDICAIYDENGVGVFGFKIEDFVDKEDEPSSEAVSEQA